MPLTVLNIGYPLAPVSPATPGGTEQVLASLDVALAKVGHRSIVIAPQGSQCHGMLFTTPPLAPPLNEQKRVLACNSQRRMIQKVLSQFAVDVIHMHGVDFYRYLPQSSVPVVVTLHLPLDWYPPELFHNKVANMHLVCVSRSQARSCPAGAEIDYVIENGVSLPRFRPVEKRDYVVALGRICPEKGFHIAIDAATQTGIPLVLAGAVFGYAAHEQYWEHEVKPRLKCPHQFLGAVGPAKKHALLSLARCLVVTSLVEETSSLVAMEAMACGTPVVALRRGALAEIVEHGRTGFLVDTPGELPHAIWASKGLSAQECRQRAETLFSCERMTSGYLRLYQQLASDQCVECPTDISTRQSAA
jgi:glycosyltransferase involved in cell wall biosynthesis